MGPVGLDRIGLSREHGSTETSRASLQRPATPGSPDTQTSLNSPRSPIEPRVLFSPDRVSSAGEDDARSHDDEDLDETMAPGTRMEISAEGYADDMYMLPLCAMSLVMMLQATGRWITLMGEEINMGKSLISVQHTARETLEAQRVELNGGALPQQHEFR